MKYDKALVHARIASLIFNKLKNGGVYAIFDFENLNNEEFKEIYGFSKGQIKSFLGLGS